MKIAETFNQFEGHKDHNKQITQTINHQTAQPDDETVAVLFIEQTKRMIQELQQFFSANKKYNDSIESDILSHQSILEDQLATVLIWDEFDDEQQIIELDILKNRLEKFINAFKYQKCEKEILFFKLRDCVLSGGMEQFEQDQKVVDKNKDKEGVILLNQRQMKDQSQQTNLKEFLYSEMNQKQMQDQSQQTNPINFLNKGTETLIFKQDQQSQQLQTQFESLDKSIQYDDVQNSDLPHQQVFHNDNCTQVSQIFVDQQILQQGIFPQSNNSSQQQDILINSKISQIDLSQTLNLKNGYELLIKLVDSKNKQLEQQIGIQRTTQQSFQNDSYHNLKSQIIQLMHNYTKIIERVSKDLSYKNKELIDLKCLYDKQDTELSGKIFQLELLTKELNTLKLTQVVSEEKKISKENDNLQVQKKIFPDFQQQDFDRSFEKIQNINSQQRPLFLNKNLRNSRNQSRVQYGYKDIFHPILQIIMLNISSYRAENSFQQIKELIFPYRTPIEYYESQVKSLKGELFKGETSEDFKEVLKLSLQNQSLFKDSCLLPNSMLYTDSQINIIQETENILQNGQIFLSTTILFINITEFTIKLQINAQIFGKNKNTQPQSWNIWMNPENTEFQIRPNESYQYEFILSLNEISSLEYQIGLKSRSELNSKQQQTKFFLPCPFLRSIRYEKLEPNYFRQQWKENSEGLIFRSLVTQIREKELFLTFIENALLLNSSKEKDISLGLCDAVYGVQVIFENEQQSITFFAKIRQTPKDQFIIQVCSNKINLEKLTTCPIVRLMKLFIQQNLFILGI